MITNQDFALNYQESRRRGRPANPPQVKSVNLNLDMVIIERLMKHAPGRSRSAVIREILLYHLRLLNKNK